MNTPRADSATGERQEQPALQVRLKTDLAGLAPAYFGLVMATGIVSLAARLQGWLQLSSTLFYLNNVMYVVLWLLTFGRLLWFPRRFFSSLPNPTLGRGPLLEVGRR